MTNGGAPRAGCAPPCDGEDAVSEALRKVGASCDEELFADVGAEDGTVRCPGIIGRGAPGLVKPADIGLPPGDPGRGKPGAGLAGGAEPGGMPGAG